MKAKPERQNCVSLQDARLAPVKVLQDAKQNLNGMNILISPHHAKKTRDNGYH